MAGKRGLGKLDLFESPRYRDIPVGQVRCLQNADLQVSSSRTEQLAAKACTEALLQSGHTLLADRKNPERWGVFAGTTVAGMLATENYFQAVWSGRPGDASVLRRHPSSSLSLFLSKKFNMQGWVTTLSTACSSGLNALVLGAEMIRAGQIDKALVVGADSLARIVVNGFGALLIVDAKGARPFDQDRRGLSLGEGAGAVVLEKATDISSASTRCLGFVSGWGNTCDAYHATAPEPEGRGAQAAMAKAVAKAGLALSQIDYINAHGTGTPDNDLAESRALEKLFGAQAIPLVSSTKGACGHTLGAAGAIESVICVQTLLHDQMPGTIGCQQPDGNLLLQPLLTTRGQTVHAAMNNSFGFGGNNTSVVFEKGDH